MKTNEQTLVFISPSILPSHLAFMYSKSVEVVQLLPLVKLIILN
jgi:hypothetical protein